MKLCSNSLNSYLWITTDWKWHSVNRSCDPGQPQAWKCHSETSYFDGEDWGSKKQNLHRSLSAILNSSFFLLQSNSKLSSGIKIGVVTDCEAKTQILKWPTGTGRETAGINESKFGTSKWRSIAKDRKQKWKRCEKGRMIISKQFSYTHLINQSHLVLSVMYPNCSLM